MKLLLTAATLVLLAHATPVAAQNDSVRTTPNPGGMFTAAQAEHGLAMFREICAVCHSTSQFSGPAFEKKWVGRRVFDLFEQLRTTMPQDNPGRLTRAQYLAIVSYLLKLNGYPASETPLPDNDEHLKSIPILSKRVP
jgi:mono/diheme cytochrome c family protein